MPLCAVSTFPGVCLTAPGFHSAIRLVPIIVEAEVPNILTGLGWQPRSLGERTWRCTIATPNVGTVRLVTRHAGAWLYLKWFERARGSFG